MHERSWTTVDKTDWGDGPWNDEPDKIQWIDEATGLDCLAHRSGTGGNWCGYVGVPPEHPLHGADYQSLDVDVHGGLTYADRCQEGWPDESQGVCHVPESGRPADVWWFGFDAAHAWDVIPAMAARERDRGWPAMPDWPGGPRTEYRDLGFIRSEVASLARQLAAVVA